MQEMFFKDAKQLQIIQLAAVVYAASEIYEDKPVRILDLATGPNGFNPRIIKRLVERHIDYELVLSDISPTHFKIGYDNLEKELSSEELKKVKCVLADSADLRKEYPEYPLWDEHRIESLEKILDNPKYYRFLRTGYTYGKRNETFSDNSFDLIIGDIPYTSMKPYDYSAAIAESIRVLKIGGYHIISEMHNIKMNRDMKRTQSALNRAKIKTIDIIKEELDSKLHLEGLYSSKYIYRTEERIPDQTLQYGDKVKLSVLVHQKVY